MRREGGSGLEVEVGSMLSLRNDYGPATSMVPNFQSFKFSA